MSDHASSPKAAIGYQKQAKRQRHADEVVRENDALVARSSATSYRAALEQKQRSQATSSDSDLDASSPASLFGTSPNALSNYVATPIGSAPVSSAVKTGSSSSQRHKGPQHQRSHRVTTRGTTEYGIVDATNGQISKVDVGPPRQLTDPGLQIQGFQVHKRLKESKGRSRPAARYKISKNPRKDFQVGNIIELLWAEPMNDATDITEINALSNITSIRRFVVVGWGATACAALAITTNNGRGVAVPGIIKSNYAIIYIGRTVPPLLPGEEATRRDGIGDSMRTPIQAELAERTRKLDERSRLNFGKTYQIDYTNEIFVYGCVLQESMADLLYQWRAVMESSAVPPTPTVSGASHTRADSHHINSTRGQDHKLPELPTGGESSGDVAVLTQQMNVLAVRAQQFGADLSVLPIEHRHMLAQNDVAHQRAYVMQVLQRQNPQRHAQILNSLRQARQGASTSNEPDDNANEDSDDDDSDSDSSDNDNDSEDEPD